MITNIFSYLISPGRGLEHQPRIGAAEIPLDSPVHRHLQGTYESASRECKIEISFTPADGEQRNDCRHEIVAIVENTTLTNGNALANRLQMATTNRSGLALLFVVKGEIDGVSRVLLSRFPADSGVSADFTGGTLHVEFVEKIFLRNVRSYKSALFEGRSLTNDFWDGRAIDRQVSDTDASIAEYWIKGFLLSDFKTTSRAGSMRIANALRNASRSGSPEAQQEIAACATLARRFDGQMVSGEGFLVHSGLSERTVQLVAEFLPNQRTLFEEFQFSLEEFQRHLTYRSIELDTGAIITAETSTFDQAVSVEYTGGDNAVRVVAEGRLDKDYLRQRK